MLLKLFFETKRFNGRHACIYLQNLREVRANLTKETNSSESFIRDRAAEMLMVFFFSLSFFFENNLCLRKSGFYFYFSLLFSYLYVLLL